MEGPDIQMQQTVSIFSSVYSGREVTHPFLGKWATSLNNSWGGKTELGIHQSTVPFHFMGQTLWHLPWRHTQRITADRAVDHSTHTPFAPQLPAGHLLSQIRALLPSPCLPETSTWHTPRAEAQQANDSQMLLNGCKNTVHKWTTWHLGLLVFLPVKRSPQESILSAFTDRNALWKIIYKHKRLAIQSRAVFPHNFI